MMFRPALFLCVAWFALTSSGCIASRMDRLEARLRRVEKLNQELKEATEGQSLQVDSVSTGLDKLNSRVEAAAPASAQWMPLKAGATLKWYIDEEVQNVYLQYLEAGRGHDGVVLTVISGNAQGTLELRPGVTRQYRFADASGDTRSLLVTFHRLLLTSQQEGLALISIDQALPPLP